MAKIAIDLDSTLYDFSTAAREGFLKLAEERGDKNLFKGAYHAWTEWRSPADICGLDVWLDVIALCHDEEVISQQVPFAGAVDTCWAMEAAGHELLYISNRNTESTRATHDWLHKWNFPQYESLICLMGSKDPHLADCQYIIDDRPKTLVEFVYSAEWQNKERTVAEWESDYQRRGFGLTYPYNQALTDIPNIYLAPTWAGLSFYLVGKGIISEPAHKALEAA